MPANHSNAKGTNMAPTISKTIDQAAVQLTRDGDTPFNSEFGEGAGPVTFGFGENRKPGLAWLYDGFSRFSEDQIAAAEQALDLWSDVANISFQRVLRFDGSALRTEVM